MTKTFSIKHKALFKYQHFHRYRSRLSLMCVCVCVCIYAADIADAAPDETAIGMGGLCSNGTKVRQLDTQHIGIFIQMESID